MYESQTTGWPLSLKSGKNQRKGKRVAIIRKSQGILKRKRKARKIIWGQGEVREMPGNMRVEKSDHPVKL